MLPSAPKNSADCNAPLPLSPPVKRMRPSFSRTAEPFERACDRLLVAVQLPMVIGVRVALRIPAKKINARTSQRRFGAFFIRIPQAKKSKKDTKLRCGRSTVKLQLGLSRLYAVATAN